MDSLHVKEESIDDVDDIAEDTLVIAGSPSPTLAVQTSALPSIVLPQQAVTQTLSIAAAQHTARPRVELDKLPRKVSELNCRQARSYLVRVMRAWNGGENPCYGVPEKRPPFWPDHIWPWTKITDVHTKPKGMVEPMQYSVMMREAINAGYRYFGIDPDDYIDPNIEEVEKNNRDPDVRAPSAQWRLKETDAPPRLPRPASKMNCLQTRTVLSKLLRYQLQGNNPMYGSKHTQPPWWPDDLIKWVDMVDLRGKPPYLPPDLSYTAVLKIAVERAMRYYGQDPETYLEESATNLIPMSPALNHALLQTASSSIVPARTTPPTRAPPTTVFVPSQSAPSTSAYPVTILVKEPTTANDPAIVVENPAVAVGSTDRTGERVPPKLTGPLSKLNCGEIRTCLSKLLWFHNHNMPPCYGSPASRPSWWPDSLIPWVHLKNLRHKYDGPLGNSYTFCLRKAVQLGYEFYGLDAETFWVYAGSSESSELIAVEPVTYADESEQGLADNIAAEFEPVVFETSPTTSITPVRVESPITPMTTTLNKTFKKPKKPLPALKAVSSSELMNTPAKRVPKTAQISASNNGNNKENDDPRPHPTFSTPVKKCKVVLDKRSVEKWMNAPKTLKNPHPNLMENFRDDLERQMYTDCVLRSAEGNEISVHRCVLARRSPLFAAALEKDCTVILPDIPYEPMKHIVRVLYGDQIILCQKDKEQFLMALKILEPFGLLSQPDLVTTEPTVCPAPESVDSDDEVLLSKKRKSGATAEKPSGKRRRKQAMRSLTESEWMPKKTKNRASLDSLTKERLLTMVGYGQQVLAKWLVQLELLRTPRYCSVCFSPCELTADDKSRDEVSWSCNKSGEKGDHDRGLDVRKNSIYDGDERSLEAITFAFISWKNRADKDKSVDLNELDLEEIESLFHERTDINSDSQSLNSQD